MTNQNLSYSLNRPASYIWSFADNENTLNINNVSAL